MEPPADPPWDDVVTILRVIRGWNQRELADALAVSESAISRYEDGSRPPPLGRLVAAMGFPPHLPDRTLSFVRAARAARESYLVARTLPQPGRIDVIAGEAGLWLETLTRDALGLVLDGAWMSDGSAVPAWWTKAATSVTAGRTADPNPAPRATPLGQALVILRVIRKWTRLELAAALAIPEATLANWERGKSRPRIAILERIGESMGFPPAMLGRTLAFVEAARAARDWHLGTDDQALRAQAGAVAASAAQSLEDFTRGLLRRLVAAARLLRSRHQAPALWARLRACTEEAQLDLVREAAEFQTSGLCELLCEESRGAAGDSAERAIHLASCAVLVAERLPGAEGSRRRLESYARAHLANAVRVGGDLNQADRELQQAEERWSASVEDDPGLLNEARVLHLKASLRRDQRRLHEALALLDQALAIDRWSETPSLLMGKAKALEELGQHEAAIALLRQACSQVDGQREPRNLFVARAQLLTNLCHLGRHAEAELGLPEVRALARKLRNQLDLLRVDWLHGKVAAGLGRVDEAVAALGRVRGSFMAQKNAYDTALVTLELAEVYATIGRTAEVKALARESAPIFADQGLHREAQRALDLFRQAAEEERVSAELVRGVITYLYRSRHDSQARYEAAA
jgi:transcriptional regulator with XRE-family HTH domain